MSCSKPEIREKSTQVYQLAGVPLLIRTITEAHLGCIGARFCIYLGRLACSFIRLSIVRIMLVVMFDFSLMILKFDEKKVLDRTKRPGLYMQVRV